MYKILLFLIFFSLNVFSTNYYVSPSGSDANSGSLALPYLTIAKAVTVLNPGDTVLIRGGTYNLSAQIDNPPSGTLGNPIVYKAYKGETPLISGSSATGFTCFNLVSSSNLVFDSLKFITNTSIGGGAFYFEGASNVTIINCDFSGSPANSSGENPSVIREYRPTSGSSTNVLIKNNYFHDNGSNVSCVCMYQTVGWVIENNKISNCWEGLRIKDHVMNTMVKHNLFVNITTTSFYVPGQSGMAYDTIIENIVDSADIAYNLQQSSTGGAYRQYVYIHNNTFFKCRVGFYGFDDGYTNNYSFYNNILYDPNVHNLGQGSGIAGRLISFNNGYSPGLTTSNYYINYNSYYMPSGDNSNWALDGTNYYYGSLASWVSAKGGFDVNSLTANPVFVSNGTDFHLQGTSPCKTAGLGGVDIGAYPRGNDGTIIGIDTSGQAVGPSVSSLVPDSTSVTGGKKIALNGTGFTGTTVKIGNGGYAGATSQTMTSVGSTVDTITSTAKSRGLYKVYVTDGSSNVDSSKTIYFYKASLIFTPSSRTENQNSPSPGYLASDSVAGDPWDSIGFKTTLPTGLSLNHSTGAITGTPTVTQSATAYVFYAWKYGYKNDSATVTITVATAAVLYDSSMTWQLSTNNFATTVLNVTTIDTNYIVITPLSYSTTYQFRVRNNNVDTNSVWSDTTTFTTMQMQMPVPDTVISVYPSVARIDALSTKAQRTIVVKEHGPNKCTVNTVIWLGTAPLGFNTLYTDSTVTDTLFKYPTLPIGTFRVYLTDPSWSPTVSDTLLSAIRLLNPSIIVTKP